MTATDLSTVYLGLGSNVDAETNLRAGVAALRIAFSGVRLSPAYRSTAVGFSGADFINLAASITTSLQPHEIKQFLNTLEADFGRTRETPKYSDRTLDIDILLWDDLYARLPGLSIPRPEILEYAHVLAPLADLAPDVVHPVELRTLKELWQEFSGDRNAIAPIDIKL